MDAIQTVIPLINLVLNVVVITGIGFVILVMHKIQIKLEIMHTHDQTTMLKLNELKNERKQIVTCETEPVDHTEPAAKLTQKSLKPKAAKPAGWSEPIVNAMIGKAGAYEALQRKYVADPDAKIISLHPSKNTNTGVDEPEFSVNAQGELLLVQTDQNGVCFIYPFVKNKDWFRRNRQVLKKTFRIQNYKENENQKVTLKTPSTAVKVREENGVTIYKLTQRGMLTCA